ncbi:uncharacterized protein AMSG_08819 [Thecamonas trahens ATCC 50062]|uniref:Uncharacterized protein n=1 Tax=Thecamonas trahens ATCC 50062 TaxID=461836 RepID=A0A0L0DPH3_THETB|nr:hypothetical protein AMSG_08819 [Thecamonas trahens ATCC 50062]KNC53323.1 hypothetical protein AMSG_08819 [Thecamonas trahens ATCC 50062]|eukprot:XP_013754582.1 hypothetical protein AMSG_08819 [Thecamonas trahens ATCC 50062]
MDIFPAPSIFRAFRKPAHGPVTAVSVGGGSASSPSPAAAAAAAAKAGLPLRPLLGEAGSGGCKDGTAGEALLRPGCPETAPPQALALAVGRPGCRLGSPPPPSRPSSVFSPSASPRATSPGASAAPRPARTISRVPSASLRDARGMSGPLGTLSVATSAAPMPAAAGGVSAAPTPSAGGMPLLASLPAMPLATTSLATTPRPSTPAPMAVAALAAAEPAASAAVSLMDRLEAQRVRIEAENAELNSEVEDLTRLLELQEAARDSQETRLSQLSSASRARSELRSDGVTAPPPVEMGSRKRRRALLSARTNTPLTAMALAAKLRAASDALWVDVFNGTTKPFAERGSVCVFIDSPPHKRHKPLPSPLR